MTNIHNAIWRVWISSPSSNECCVYMNMCVYMFGMSHTNLIMSVGRNMVSLLKQKHVSFKHTSLEIYVVNSGKIFQTHYSDVTMSMMASQTTGVSIVCSTVCSTIDQRTHQSSTSLAFVRGIYRWLLNSPHKGPVTRKTLPFDDVIMPQW